MSINDTILTRKAIHCDLLISFHIVNKVSIFYPGCVNLHFLPDPSITTLYKQKES